jgi:transposase
MNEPAHNESGVYLAIECGRKEWKLALGDGKAERQVTIRAGDVKGLGQHLGRAKERFGLPADARVYSCYEAGRDGFWIHRMLTGLGVSNVVVDPASIEVQRRGKRVKTDRLDARKLLTMLRRYWVYEERKTWRVLHIPDEDQEDARRPSRERERLTKERTGHRARIRSLLALHGRHDGKLPASAAEARDWKGAALPVGVAAELDRELERLRMVEAQIRRIDGEWKATDKSPSMAKAKKLARVKGVGTQTGWRLAHEFLWRSFRNRREVGAASGLVGCPYDSGESRVEQGISKAGNARVRATMTELAWRWLMFQPQSALARWYQRRFGAGSGRMRRIGIVALARKLLVALWKYVEFDEVPAEAIVKA